MSGQTHLSMLIQGLQQIVQSNVSEIQLNIDEIKGLNFQIKLYTKQNSENERSKNLQEPHQTTKQTPEALEHQTSFSTVG